MTVAELIEELVAMPSDLIVVIEETGDYLPVDQMEFGDYNKGKLEFWATTPDEPTNAVLLFPKGSG